MPGENIYSWSTTAGNNGTADTLIDWHEGQARASVNNSARGMMAGQAKNRNLLTGQITTTGTPNVQSFVSGMGFAPSDTIPTGFLVKLKIGAGLSNTGPATLNMDGTGDITIKTAEGAALAGGELVGNGYVDFLFDGTNWIHLYSREFFQHEILGGSGIVISQQVFATAGTFTYTPSAEMACAIIECIGGGGGGGGATSSVTFAGGGGGSGGYSRKLATAAAVGASQTITVGAGGTGVNNAAGNAGADTFVGSLCRALGGAGGGVGSSASAGPGGVGGAGGAGTGDIIASGAAGACGGYNSTTNGVAPSGGVGGAGTFGGSGLGAAFVGSVGGINGGDGSNYGSGGGGGVAVIIGTAAGGNGSPGAVIITEYAGRGVPGVQGPIGPAGPSGPGTGDVLRSGTPVAGQYAQWTDGSHIQGVSLAMQMPNYLGGLTLSNDAISSNTVLDIAIGGASSDDNTMTMTLLSAFTKNCNAAFAAGTGNGALDAGSTLAASTWYHVFLISTGSVSDVLISTSASAPVMPSPYTKKRRIGSIKTNASSQILAFSQQGDEFLFAASTLDVNANNPGTTAVVRTLNVPIGVKVWARIRAVLSNLGTAAGSGMVLSELDRSDEVVAVSAAPLIDTASAYGGVGGAAYSGGNLTIRTNTLAQIRSRLSYSDANVTLYIASYGWFDDRGK